MLRQRTFGCNVPAVVSLSNKVLELSDLPERDGGQPAEKTMIEALEPLLPLLGLKYSGGLPDVPEKWGETLMEARDSLLAWLKEKASVSLISPFRGAAYDPETMETVETRRTVHASEHETVAKVERVGLMWRDRPLVRAQVVRYASEGIK
jgi:molecular chaperone GrpE (heat shock protein)